MGKICAFFGHRDTLITTDLENRLEKLVRTLILNYGFDEFWCCEQGTFDWISRMVMQRVKQDFPYIYLCYVCAYNPNKYPKIRQLNLEERYEIIYTNEIADGPVKFAINRRNKYIAENVDLIIGYINQKSGGAYKAVKHALANNKDFINLADYPHLFPELPDIESEITYF